MIRHNNIKKDGSQALENESEDSKSEEGRSRKKKRNELKNAITPRVVRLCTVASFGPY